MATGSPHELVAVRELLAAGQEENVALDYGGGLLFDQLIGEVQQDILAAGFTAPVVLDEQELFWG